MKNPALKVAGVIFFCVSIMHLLRLILKIDVAVAGIVLPRGISAVGFIVPLLLSIWMFQSSKWS